MVIIEGSCIVNEAMLSGESTPQGKESIILRDSDDLLEMTGADKNNVLFGGTKVLQVSPPESTSSWKSSFGWLIFSAPGWMLGLCNSHWIWNITGSCFFC